jgi:predicted RNA-binding protein YlxR (DUF448 family)
MSMKRMTLRQNGGRPVRTCCGCGQRDFQEKLLRLTLVDGRLTVDPERRGQGRGAYLHRQSSCWGAFVRGKGYVRSLRRRLSQEERAIPAQMIGRGGETGRDAGFGGAVPGAPQAG